MPYRLPGGRPSPQPLSQPHAPPSRHTIPMTRPSVATSHTYDAAPSHATGSLGSVHTPCHTIASPLACLTTARQLPAQPDTACLSTTVSVPLRPAASLRSNAPPAPPPPPVLLPPHVLLAWLATLDHGPAMPCHAHPKPALRRQLHLLWPILHCGPRLTMAPRQCAKC